MKRDIENLPNCPLVPMFILLPFISMFLSVLLFPITIPLAAWIIDIQIDNINNPWLVIGLFIGVLIISAYLVTYILFLWHRIVWSRWPWEYRYPPPKQ